MQPLPLVDSYGRRHRSLRLSVTDRCNIRCFYCMPAESLKFLPKSQLLRFEEIVQIAELLTRFGVDRIRVTGGEPLVRGEISKLVEMLHALPGIREIAMTTNGILLPEHAASLKAAGLDRLNISLDSLDPVVFQQITRRDFLPQVLQGIDAALAAGFPVRLNALAIRNLTEPQIVPLARFALERQMELRFIEYMPLDFDRQWQGQQVLTAEEIRAHLEKEWGPVVPAPRNDPAQPAQDFHYADGKGRLGLIHSVSQPFCSTCDRLRLTAEGQLRNCLFSSDEWDLRELLRSGASAEMLEQRVRECVASKWAGHQIGSDNYQYPDKSMHQIGG